jgi:hypothetical protein
MTKSYVTQDGLALRLADVAARPHLVFAMFIGPPEGSDVHG